MEYRVAMTRNGVLRQSEESTMKLIKCSRVVLAVCAIALVPWAGCADEPAEPVAYSETVSLKLGGIKESDLDKGQLAISRDKNVNAESGNPYKVFLDDARAALGRDPGSIRVSQVFVRVHADTTGVTSFEEVFATLEVFLADSATTIPVGDVDAPTGSSIEIPVGATEATLDALQESLQKDDFKVGARGDVMDTLPDKFDLRLTIDIKFEALP